MNKIWNKVVEIFLNKQFIFFVIIGMINTMSSAVFSVIYSYILGDVEAFLPGYFTGVIISYVLNTIITFKDSFGVIKFIKFFISTIPNFLIQTIVVYIGINYLCVPNYVSYISAAAIGVPVTFLILKVYVFVKR